MSDRPWGTKLTISVYIEGEPDSDSIFKATNEIDAILETEFIGVQWDVVETKPTDQAAS